ncbi:hypothetical protein [Streptomyces sp. NBC_00887]|uniref:hypothetical protein n=1 Tax=Streptomyces sp. NBC_00887 TaxID=2975859 RepID=UPI00386E6A6D|nr:hypothetical protein OG844_18095 [Streptomyces sp. NBC_00887]
MTDRAPDRHAALNGGTEGFGRPVVNSLARATAVTCRASGGKTVIARPARWRDRPSSRTPREYNLPHVEA